MASMASRFVVNVFLTSITWNLVEVAEPQHGGLGGNITLVPTVTGTLKEILWKYKGNKVVEFDGSENREFDPYVGRTILDWTAGALTINDLTEQDSGPYQLEAVLTNEKLQYSEHNVDVIAKVPQPTITCVVNVTSDTTPPATMATLLCSADPQDQRSMMTFSWVDSPHIGPDLSIPVRDKHDEVFKCLVKNPVSEMTAQFNVKDCFKDESSTTWLAVVLTIILSVVILIAIILVVFWYRKYRTAIPVESNTDAEKSLLKRQAAEDSQSSPGSLEESHLLEEADQNRSEMQKNIARTPRNNSHSATLPSTQPLARLDQSGQNLEGHESQDHGNPGSDGEKETNQTIIGKDTDSYKTANESVDSQNDEYEDDMMKLSATPGQTQNSQPSTTKHTNESGHPDQNHPEIHSEEETQPDQNHPEIHSEEETHPDQNHPEIHSEEETHPDQNHPEIHSGPSAEEPEHQTQSGPEESKCESQLEDSEYQTQPNQTEPMQKESNPQSLVGKPEQLDIDSQTGVKEGDAVEANDMERDGDQDRKTGEKDTGEGQGGADESVGGGKEPGHDQQDNEEGQNTELGGQDEGQNTELGGQDEGQNTELGGQEGGADAEEHRGEMKPILNQEPEGLVQIGVGEEKHKHQNQVDPESHGGNVKQTKEETKKDDEKDGGQGSRAGVKPQGREHTDEMQGPEDNGEAGDTKPDVRTEGTDSEEPGAAMNYPGPSREQLNQNQSDTDLELTNPQIQTDPGEPELETNSGTGELKLETKPDPEVSKHQNQPHAEKKPHLTGTADGQEDLGKDGGMEIPGGEEHGKLDGQVATARQTEAEGRNPVQSMEEKREGEQLPKAGENGQRKEWADTDEEGRDNTDDKLGQKIHQGGVAMEQGIQRERADSEEQGEEVDRPGGKKITEADS